MEMRRDPRARRDAGRERPVHEPRVERAQTDPPDALDGLDAARGARGESFAARGRARRSRDGCRPGRSPGSRRDQPPRSPDDFVAGDARASPADAGDDAVRAAEVAAVLDLEEGPRPVRDRVPGFAAFPAPGPAASRILAARPSFSAFGTTIQTPGIRRNSSDARSAKQPVTTIRASGLSRATRRMNRRTSRSARPVRVQELTRTIIAASGSLPRA